MRITILEIFSVAILLSQELVKAGPITIYAVGPASQGNPEEGISTILNLTAIGVGADGGVTYSEVAIATGSITLSLISAPITSTTFDHTATIAEVFVQGSNWVFNSVADESNKFNNFERNCTLNDSGDAGNCTEVIRNIAVNAGQTSTTTFATTYPGTATPIYTYTGPLPTQPASSSLPQSCLNIGWPVLAAICSIMALI